MGLILLGLLLSGLAGIRDAMRPDMKSLYKAESSSRAEISFMKIAIVDHSVSEPWMLVAGSTAVLNCVRPFVII